MADTLSSGVGAGQANLPADVALVQTLLNGHTDVTGQLLTVDGLYGPNTLAAIVAYQRVALGMVTPDGVLSPSGPTFASLAAADVALSAVGVPDLLGEQSPVPVSLLTDADFAAAAAALSCEVAAIKAVSTVETGPQGAFDPQGRPTILFERHLFSRATKGIYDASNPDISNPVAGGYGLFSAQYGKMARAAALNMDAALGSASWGMFQILGQNFAAAGFKDVESYVVAMRSGVGAHLTGFVSFIAADAVKLTAIQRKDWATFAARYNGPNYAASGYDKKLAAAYVKNSGG